MLQIALIVVAALVALVGIINVVGMMVPRRHVASRSARYLQPPDRVWTMITDLDAMPAWRPGIKRIERLPDDRGRAVWIEHTGHGPLPLAVVESDAPRRLVCRINDDKLPFGGTWTYAITPSDDGAELRITEDGEIRSPMFRFMARFVFGYHRTMEQYLTALGAQFGQNVVPEA